MARLSGPSTGRTAQSAAPSAGCPSCGTELRAKSGLAVCPDCDWFQRFPAD